MAILGKRKSKSKSLELAKDGGVTGVDFARLMSALMSDVIEGTITPEISNATVNAGGKLLKAVEMQYKYASSSTGENTELLLAPKRKELDN